MSLYNKRIYAGIMFAFLMLTQVRAGTVSLFADSLKYTSQKKIIASGNVLLEHELVTLNADYVLLDPFLDTFLARGQVSMNFADQQIHSDEVLFDLQNDQVRFNEMVATFHAEEAASPVFFHSQNLSKYAGFFEGYGAGMSTCPPDKEYYTIDASRFVFYPDDKIVGYDVYAHADWWPMFYTPYYEFQLGYRNPIYLFPVIGQNRVEGQFIKNTLDYYLNADVKTLILIDRLENFGWGLGLDATFFADRDMPIRTYIYHVDNENYTMSYDQTFRLTQNNTIHFTGNLRDMYALSGSRQHVANQEFSWTKDKDKVDVKLNNNLEQSYQQQFFDVYKVQGDWTHQFKLNRSYYERSGQENLNWNVHNSLKGLQHRWNFRSVLPASGTQFYAVSDVIDWTAPFGTRVNFQNQYKNTLVGTGPGDEWLNPRLSIVQPLNQLSLARMMGLSQVELKLNGNIDIDGDVVTRDDRDNLQETLPELNFQFNNANVFGFNYTPRLSVGRYHEKRNVQGTLRDVTHQRLVLSNTIQRILLNNPWLKLHGQGRWGQYLYETGDKQFDLLDQWILTVGPGQNVENQLQFVDQYFMGYTPFYFDELRTRKRRLTNTFKWKLLPAALLTIRDGYDFLGQNREPEQFQWSYKPLKDLTWQLNTAYDHQQLRWHQLQHSLVYKKNPDEYAIWSLNYDLMTGRVKDSRLQLGALYQAESRWKLRTEFVWNENQNRFRIPFLELTRDMGCIEMIYKYQDGRQEHTFLVRVTAFPDQPLGVSADQDGIDIKGLEQNSVAR